MKRIYCIKVGMKIFNFTEFHRSQIRFYQERKSPLQQCHGVAIAQLCRALLIRNDQYRKRGLVTACCWEREREKLPSRFLLPIDILIADCQHTVCTHHPGARPVCMCIARPHLIYRWRKVINNICKTNQYTHIRVTMARFEPLLFLISSI